MSPGGDFALSPSAAAAVGGEGTYVWTSTPTMVADVQAWLVTPSDNFGWLLIGNEGLNNSARRFDSREATATGSMLPALVVTYAPVPEASTWVLLVAGLGLLGCFARRHPPAPVSCGF